MRILILPAHRRRQRGCGGERQKFTAADHQADCIPREMASEVGEGPGKSGALEGSM
jgi:hypothetical protein